jgi:hypothetical protein
MRNMREEGLEEAEIENAKMEVFSRQKRIDKIYEANKEWIDINQGI